MLEAGKVAPVGIARPEDRQRSPGTSAGPSRPVPRNVAKSAPSRIPNHAGMKMRQMPPIAIATVHQAMNVWIGVIPRRQIKPEQRGDVVRRQDHVQRPPPGTSPASTPRHVKPFTCFANLGHLSL